MRMKAMNITAADTISARTALLPDSLAKFPRVEGGSL
jgi:hypothetical protein